MQFSIRFRLCLMMALQYGAWGAWAAVAGKYFTTLGEKHGFTGASIGFIFSLLPLATILTPFLAGQLADRAMNSEKLLGILQLFSGVLLFSMARQTNFKLFAILMFVYALFFAPTAALTNTLAFHHIDDPSRQFSGIRVWGTIGWIIAGWMLGAWRTFPGLVPQGDLFYLAGVLSLVLGIYSFFLPATPPAKSGKNPLAFLAALKLLRNRDFAGFMLVSLLASTALDFHYIFASAFLGLSPSLNGMGVSDRNLPLVMSLAQISEIAVMLLLPFMLPKLGIRRALVLGTLAWAIRYSIFAQVPIKSVVVASLALHGFCVSFFFVTIYIYAEQVAPGDIRASVQSLVFLVMSGLGRWIGSYYAGGVKTLMTSKSAQGVNITNWRMVFLIPAVMMLICAVAFPLLFKETAKQPEQA